MTERGFFPTIPPTSLTTDPASGAFAMGTLQLLLGRPPWVLMAKLDAGGEWCT